MRPTTKRCQRCLARPMPWSYSRSRGCARLPRRNPTRDGRRVAVLDELSGGAWDLAAFDVRRVHEVIASYQDQGIGVADASIVVMAERYERARSPAWTIDISTSSAPSTVATFRCSPAQPGRGRANRSAPGRGTPLSVVWGLVLARITRSRTASRRCEPLLRG